MVEIHFSLTLGSTLSLEMYLNNQWVKYPDPDD